MNRRATTVPLTELHVHLEGTIAPRHARALAARDARRLAASVDRAGERYVATGFSAFLRNYDAVAGLLRDGDDYAAVTDAYLQDVAAMGTIYVELTASPTHAAALGVGWDEHLHGISTGIERAHAATGIEARIIVVGLRHRQPEEALAIARRATATAAAGGANGLLTGFGLAGDERAAPLTAFAPALEMAASAGLGCTVHAGELLGPSAVTAALALPVARIGHGIRANEDDAVLAELVARRIVLEVCPTSNVALGVAASYAEHPLRSLFDAGVLVTLGSDDPPHFGTTIEREYRIAREHFGFDDEELRAITRNAVRAAFVDEPTRRRLLACVG